MENRTLLWLLIVFFNLFSSLSLLAKPAHFYAQVKYYESTLQKKNLVLFSAEQNQVLRDIGQEFLDCGDQRLFDEPKILNRVCPAGKVIFSNEKKLHSAFSDKIKAPYEQVFQVELELFKFENLTYAETSTPVQFILSHFYLYAPAQQRFEFIGSRIFFAHPQYFNQDQVLWPLIEQDLKKQKLIPLIDLPSFDPPEKVALQKLTFAPEKLSPRALYFALLLIEQIPEENFSPELQQSLKLQTSALLQKSQQNVSDPFETPALQILLKYKFLKETIEEALIPLLKEKEKPTASNAFEQLKPMKLSAHSLKKLSKPDYLQNEQEFTRFFSLYLCSQEAKNFSKEFFIGTLQDSSWRIQEIALKALHEFTSTENDFEWLDAFLENSQSRIVVSSISLLGKINGPVATWKLLKKSNHPEAAVRAEVLKQLSQGRMNHRSLEVLEQNDYIHNANPRIRESVVRLLVQINLPKTLRILKQRLSLETDPQVRDLILTHLKVRQELQ